MEDYIYKSINLSFIFYIFNTLWVYNIRKSKKPALLDKLKNEKPLDDIIHYNVSPTFFNKNIHAFCDLSALFLPLYIMFLYYKTINFYRLFIELGVFHVYKQIVCISTRLPPSLNINLIQRKLCGFTVATTIDYGISGHTSFPVLLFFHTKSNIALLFSIFQSLFSVTTKDHYTIDILHTWIFILAIYNRLNFLY